MKHGKGTDIFANGDTYHGSYKDGKPHGPGKYTWANGNYYDGEFRKGLKNGKGIWKKFIIINKDSPKKRDQLENKFKTNYLFYEGEYVKDKKHGQGYFLWPSGNYYKG
jgi:hypothetical protein